MNTQDQPLRPFRPDPAASSLLDGKPYVPHERTDVQATWRRFGWRPIAESNDQGQKGEANNT